MSAGDRWRMPDGVDGVELDRSGGLLRLAPIVPGWPWPAPPGVAAEHLCTRQPSRYLGGAIPQETQPCA